MQARHALLLGLAAVMVVALFVAGDMAARADNSLPTNRPSKHPNQSSVGRTRVGGYRTIALGADAEWTCLANDDQGGFLIPWYSAVEVSGAGGGWACFSMTIAGGDIAIDTTTGAITDSQGNDGLGPCFRLQSGRLYAQVLDPWNFTSATANVLRRQGVCVDNFDAGINSHTGAPCRTNDECHSDGGAQICYGGADGGTNEIATGRIAGAYLCWTSGAVDGVHIE